jgi:hypothetical protein
MTDDALAAMRRWHRREYLRQHEQQRRADLKAEGARRIDVTLRGEALDDYSTVRSYIEGLNRLARERGFFNTTKTRADGTVVKLPAIRLSDAEVIKMALSRAASSIQEDDDDAAKHGGIRFLE